MNGYHNDQSNNGKGTQFQVETENLGGKEHGCYPLRRSPEFEESGIEEMDYVYSDFTQKTYGQLESLRLDLNFADDESNPAYSISERVRQLNKELAEEEPPSIETRNQTIRFKENLVDFIAPSPDLDMDDAESRNSSDDETASNGSAVSGKDRSVTPGNQEMTAHKDNGQGEERSASSSKSESDSVGDADEKVLLERNGKFEFIAVKDLTPEEREMFYVNSVGNDDTEPSPNAKTASSRTPKSSSSASHDSTNKLSNSTRGNGPGSDREKQAVKKPLSARANFYNDMDKKQQRNDHEDGKLERQKVCDEVYQSWLRKKKREEEEMKKSKARTEHKEDDQQKRQKMCDEAFQAWLKKKKTDEEMKKTNVKTENEEDDQSKEKANEAYDKWKAERLKQLQQERKLKEDEEKYNMDQWQTHSEKECEKNFKRWVKAKGKEAKKKEEQEREKKNTYRLYVRKSRNSASAKASIAQGNNNFVDYHGYRF